MIHSKQDYLFYLEADRVALGRKKTDLRQQIINLIHPDQIWKFQRLLRKLEYINNVKKGLFFRIYKFYLLRKFHQLSIRLGFSIPINVFGPGLSIAHYGTIIINSGTKVGANCRLHACVNIGTEAGYSDRAPIIGDNVYIGPGVKIFGSIKIADNTAIAANSVVNKSFEETNTVIGGIPAVKLKNTDIFSIIINATEIVKSGLNGKELEGLTAKDIQNLLSGNNQQ
jgi:serine O-acetyltransferase